MAGGVVVPFLLLPKWADCPVSKVDITSAVVVSRFYAYDTSRPMMQEREALTTLV
jgi:hypothetical protein